MLVLVIDTSSAAVTAAVAEVGTAAADGAGGGVTLRAEHVTINARGHGEHLAPNIASALADSGARPADLGAIVAGTGPGPYTGLRVGLVTAAVMAETLAIATYGVCSLDGIGGAVAGEGALLVAADARRKEVYWARYDHGVRTGEPRVDRPDDVPREKITAVAGQGGELYDFGVPLLEQRYPSALALARAAADRVRAGAPAEALTPLYLRRPDAEQPHAPKAVSR